MSSDRYKVKVINYFDPYLLWVEVRDPAVAREDFLFEQIGIYGILPRKKMGNGVEDVINPNCDEWVPDAADVIEILLKTSEDVYFSPIYIDTRTSIFHNKIHKYGEIILKNKNGHSKKLSKELIKSGLAYKDDREFFNKLFDDKLKTKLNKALIQEIIKELEYYCVTVDKGQEHVPKKLHKQTSKLTESSLEKHNKYLEKCENDQAIGKSQKERKSLMLTKKLSNYVDLNQTNNHHNISEVISKPKDLQPKQTYEEPSSTSTGNICSESNLKGIKKNMLSKLKRFHDLEKSKNSSSDSESLQICNLENVERKLNESENVFGRNLKKDEKTLNKSKSLQKVDDESSKHTERKDKEKDVDDDYKTERYDQFEGHSTGTFKSKNVYKPNSSISPVKPTTRKSRRTQRVAYGPPEMDRKFFKIQEITLSDYDDEEIKQEPKINIRTVTKTENRDDICVDVDSAVRLEITDNQYFGTSCIVRNSDKVSVNRSDLKNYNTVSDVIFKNDSETLYNDTKFTENLISGQCQNEPQGHQTSVECGLETNAGHNSNIQISSTGMHRELKAFNADDHNNSIGSKDTSNKDTDDSDDIEKAQWLNELEHKNYKVNVTKLKNNVNPFKNIQPDISRFVDRLVTPVLMVHSKRNRRIQPVCDMRDIYFNNHINNVLRNMGIEKPMTLQSITWFAILRGYSLFMISPTGSGKTLGYLPAICRHVTDCVELTPEKNSPVCIIVCATAHSVTDVANMAKIFLRTPNRVLSCYAGVDDMHITTTLLNGCDLLVTTPPALERLLLVTDFGVDLGRLEFFVMDDCERLSQVYAREILVCTHRINEVVKTRADKDLKVQYVLASRQWCDFMEPLAKKVAETVICIGAFQECVLYSKTNTSVALVKNDNKIESVLDFLNSIDTPKRTVIVCQTNDEVKLLKEALKKHKVAHKVFTCDNDMTIHDLANLNCSWADYSDPDMGPILICCDHNLQYMNITDANYLVHFSMPYLFSLFCKRFSVLNDKYPSIFNSDNEDVKIKVLLEENNVEQLPKILNFIKRCSDNIPSVLDQISADVLKQKDAIKAEKYCPLCDSLLTLGYCPDVFNCQERHTILKEFDAPKDWLPREGTIACKIVHFHSATSYSARILSCTVNGTTINYPQTYSTLALKMGVYYSKESNRKAIRIPKIGDFCAAAIKLNLYVRCQVVKILNRYERGNPNHVLVRLIDEERLEVIRDIYLYELQSELKEIESRVVQVRLANIQPKDEDVTFSELALERLKEITESDTALLFKGDVSLTLGNCLFVNTLEAYLHLTSLKELVVRYDFKQELLNKHAIANPEHCAKLELLCTESGLIVKEEKIEPDSTRPLENRPEGTWAHLESDSVSDVYFAAATNPDEFFIFFVRLVKFEPCMIGLLQDIKKYVDTNPKRCNNIVRGDLVLAKFPDDDTYERARIDNITEEGKANCFFVDQGDWRDISVNDLIPLPGQFISQLPFQAIECRFVGIQPIGETWTDFCCSWFVNNCYDNKGDIKCLNVKYFTKNRAVYTKGHQYSVVVIDNSTEEDVIINQMMLDLNLAQEDPNEIQYLYNFEINKSEQEQVADTEDYDSIQAVSSPKDNENNNAQKKQIVPIKSNIMSAPIRSIPLVMHDSESDESDEWDPDRWDAGNDCMSLFPALKNLQSLQENMPKVKISTAKSTHYEAAKIIELDSDDLTSPDTSFICDSNTDKAIQLGTEINQKRCPKLVWRQNKDSVIIKIQLIGADNYKLNIEDRSIDFSAEVNETEYGFKLELYGVVDKAKCSHVNKGQCILVSLKKVLTKNWLTLTWGGGVKKWIVYDVDNLVISSDEEDSTDTIKDMARNMAERDETDSDDEDSADDINIGYRKH